MGIFSGKRPTNLGLSNGRLAACSRKPNSVSSQADGRHFVEPLAFSGDTAIAWAKLKAAVKADPEAAIVEESDGYLYAECTTPTVGFVDDLELAMNASDGVIHVRSASRLGYSDFGKNRARVEAIRQRFVG